MLQQSGSSQIWDKQQLIPGDVDKYNAGTKILSWGIERVEYMRRCEQCRDKNIARIVKAALHKLPGKSSFNVSFVSPVCPVCPVWTMNGEWHSQSVRYVGMELLGQLKIQNVHPDMLDSGYQIFIRMGCVSTSEKVGLQRSKLLRLSPVNECSQDALKIFHQKILF